MYLSFYVLSLYCPSSLENGKRKKKTEDRLKLINMTSQSKIGSQPDMEHRDITSYSSVDSSCFTDDEKGSQ